MPSLLPVVILPTVCPNSSSSLTVSLTVLAVLVVFSFFLTFWVLV